VKYGPEQRVQIIWKIIENENGSVIANGGTVAFFENRNNGRFLPFSREVLLG
jgi:hypothetical protein